MTPFRTRGSILALHSIRIEDYAESTLRILLIRDGARDQVAETALREEVGVGVVEVYDHDCHGMHA